MWIQFCCKQYLKRDTINLKIELHVFLDASDRVVSTVAFFCVFSGEYIFVRSVFEKSKLSPFHGHTILRLKLCAAELSAEIATIIIKQLEVKIDDTKFHTDSRVVHGYISTEPNVLTYMCPIVLIALRELWLTGPSFLFKNCNTESYIE